MNYTPIQYLLNSNPGSRVTSPFGMRKHPTTGAYTMHSGVDIGGPPAGHPWATPYPGKVWRTGFYGSAGNTVALLLDGTNVLQLYFHLQAIKVKPGQIVKAGDILGLNGATGKRADGKPAVTGPHLHYELRIHNGSTLGSPAWGNPAAFYLRGGAKVHIVKSGEGLWAIADQYGLTREEIVALNADKYPSIVTNPGLIHPGWELNVSQPGRVHTVKPDERLWQIAKDYGLTLDQLKAANPGINYDLIKTGQQINIPGGQPAIDQAKEIASLKEQLAKVTATNNELRQKGLKILGLAEGFRE